MRWGIDLTGADLDGEGAGGGWGENVAALGAFLAIQTQWRCVMGPSGQMITTGLDYSGAKVGLKLAGIKMTPDLWADVRVIETGARAAMNEGQQ